MRLIKARVLGFQSFSDSGEVNFSDGINLFIGQNNAGKSAFLRALLPELSDDRHRTPEKWEAFRLPEPEVTLWIKISGAEIRDSILRSNSAKVVPVPPEQSQNLSPFMEEFFERPHFIIPVTRSPRRLIAQYPSHQLFSYVSGQTLYGALVSPDNGKLVYNLQVAGQQDSLPFLIADTWQREMFYFAAERMAIGEAQGGYAVRLDPNARNLPNVLHTLNNERGDVFRWLIHHLREVFPTVGNLSVRTKPDNNQLEVRVWPTDAMRHVELSFPLNSSGTGVSQIIALLTAIMTIDNAIIIIDEINSFLHPAAVKALLRILQTEYAHHQYIISTHAPEVIAFSNPTSIHVVKRTGYESTIERLDLTEVGKFREVAEHLGVSMADVFAAERIIWVEGPTEELCFPYIYQSLKRRPLPRGTIFTSVSTTGDFNTKKRDPAIVFDAYSRLCTAAATLVVTVAFSFDTEKLSESEKADMILRSSGLLHFLPRRHLECFLIDPVAIAAFIASKDPLSAQPVTPTTVEEALRAAAAQRPLLIPEWKNDIADSEWLSRVDAANLIATVSQELSQCRAPFAKKKDSLFLLQHMLEHARSGLSPLGDYVESLVMAVAAK